MIPYLSSQNFPEKDRQLSHQLQQELEYLVAADFAGNTLETLARYQKILGDNRQRDQWESIHQKLMILFKCGQVVPLDGPMIGISLSIRDSDYFQDTAHLPGQHRSWLANLEWMATLWNATFQDTGIWMGKTFEPVERHVVAKKTDRHAVTMEKYNRDTTRIGRNFFRPPIGEGKLQSIGYQMLNQLWQLTDRPETPDTKGFDSILTQENLTKEQQIPYTKTGGIFLADTGTSVVPDMHAKAVFQLNYRWPNLHPVYPMTRLVDEIVQIDDGIYLGQLVMATRHFSVAALGLEIGEAYGTDQPGWWARITGKTDQPLDYGYQNNGFFLMLDTAITEQVYDAFPAIKP